MTQAKVQSVNEILLKGEPANISVDEHSGYTGYKPQAVVDAMNEVFWGEWGFEEVSSEITPGEKGLAIAQVRVWLKDVDFKPTSYGQNRVTRGDIGDARKGAQTDAIKKALSYFSIGNRAYHGQLPDKKEQAQQARETNNQHSAQPIEIAQATKEQWEIIHSLSKKIGQPIPTSLNVNQANNLIARLQKRVDDQQASENKAAEQPATNAVDYHAVYKAGKAKNLWSAPNGFYAFASHLLNAKVNEDNVKNLAKPNLERLLKAIEEAEPMKQTA